MKSLTSSPEDLHVVALVQIGVLGRVDAAKNAGAIQVMSTLAVAHAFALDQAFSHILHLELNVTVLNCGSIFFLPY